MRKPIPEQNTIAVGTFGATPKGRLLALALTIAPSPQNHRHRSGPTACDTTLAGISGPEPSANRTEASLSDICDVHVLGLEVPWTNHCIP